MTELRYSVPALNVLRRFHRASAVVFVEGDDDRHFWRNIAQANGLPSIYVESADGVKSLDEVEGKILNDGARVIIARDADHKPFTRDAVHHPRIVYTYGYSIENTLYCPNTINDLARKLARSLSDYTTIAFEWYSKFSKTAKELLIYDVANHRFKRGITVFGNSCHRFLESASSPYLSAKKVNNFLESLSTNFSQEEVNECVSLVEADPREIRWLIKGHFLTLAVVNLIKHIVRNARSKSIALSLENLYSGTVDGCLKCNVDHCPALSAMVNRLSEAIAAV